MHSHWITTHLLKLYRRISSLELRYSAKCVYVKEREGEGYRETDRERQERDIKNSKMLREGYKITNDDCFLK